MAESYKSTRPEAYPAKTAGQGRTSAKGNRTNGGGYSGGTYYPYWLRGKVAHVRRVTI